MEVGLWIGTLNSLALSCCSLAGEHLYSGGLIFDLGGRLFVVRQTEKFAVWAGNTATPVFSFSTSVAVCLSFETLKL